jgi:endoglucanase
MTRSRRHILALTAVLLTALSATTARAVSLTGVNLAGADFGESNLPGTYNVHYTYPTSAEVDYFMGKGMNTFRIPFRWERLQQTANTPFNSAELGRLNTIVNYATSQGAYVVLDPHNYARYYGNVVGTAAVPNANFADLWSRLADIYKDNNRVVFGLMNEPNTMPTEQWRDAANSAIAAIRNAGATNLILVPGNAWTGAHSWNDTWYGTSNSTIMLGITDPQNNFAFDVHQYLDGDSSGSSSSVVSAAIGQQRLVNFTNWLHANNRRGFLGEFAVANSTIGTGGSQIGDEAIHNMLSYIETHGDVWLGWTWWAAGPWWNNYMFTLEPTNLGQQNQTDRPAMAVLQSHLALAGDYNANGAVDAADYVLWRNNGALQNEVHSLGSASAQDYAEWRSRFGSSAAGSGSGAAGSLVPEPESVLAALLAGVFYHAVRSAGPNQRFRRAARPRHGSRDSTLTWNCARQSPNHL